ncbi:hypothetical protein ANOM_001043, partial [Aspergillus nomiae NRRL 13137]
LALHVPCPRTIYRYRPTKNTSLTFSNPTPHQQHTNTTVQNVPLRPRTPRLRRRPNNKRNRNPKRRPLPRQNRMGSQSSRPCLRHITR